MLVKRSFLNKLSVFTLCYSLGTFIVALSVAWLVLAKVDFLYGVWHDVGGIAEGIEEYGPQNRYKVGFADTTRDERLRLFAEINTAIHSGGEGLDRIRFQSPSVANSQLLLREPEQVHLRDVAILIDRGFPVAAVVFAVWLAVSAYYLVRRRVLPSLRQQIFGPVFLLCLLGLILLVFGAENVFNLLHEWVFPDEHQWFFYYQDSLMSTMMLAPLLFGWIAAVWVLLAILGFCGLSLLVRYLSLRSINADRQCR